MPLSEGKNHTKKDYQVKELKSLGISLKELRDILDTLRVNSKTLKLASWDDFYSFFSTLRPYARDFFFNYISHRTQKSKEIEAYLTIINQVIDSIYAHGSKFIIPDRLPKEEGCKIIVIRSVLDSGLVKEDQIKTEVKIPTGNDKIDVLLENWRMPIELKVVPTKGFSLSPRIRRFKENNGIAQALEAKKAFGKALLLIFTNHTDYANHLEKTYLKYAEELVFVRAINYRELLNSKIYG